MNRTGRSAGALLSAALLMAAAACTADGDNGGGASASCANLFTYDDHSYLDVQQVDFTVGRKLGVATQPPCNDTGQSDKTDEPTTTTNAYKVAGLSPKAAVAIGDTPKEALLFAAHTGADLPPEVQKFIDEAR
ncbi:DUF6281 family protein [Streptomyces sp. NPDC050529]|uniref:DUF6281 family protein n=1 Tax=Streptomyces sp. NPDC050529 TaxID=3365624 RepID=UPI0037A2A1DE